jgi:hypothetical protein
MDYPAGYAKHAHNAIRTIHAGRHSIVGNLAASHQQGHGNNASFHDGTPPWFLNCVNPSFYY